MIDNVVQNERKEMCWAIKEILPVHSKKIKNRYNEWDICIKPMTMCYDTFVGIITSITHTESYGVSYDYEDGSITLCVTETGLDELNAMFDLIVID